MELKDTIEGMTSADYKERFKAEYCQVKIRARKLRETIIKLKNNQLDFNPKCSGDILHDQLVHMLAYENILRERAEIEGIDLEKIGELRKMAKNNYRYKIDTLIDNVMTPTFNPKEYIWVLGSKVLASLVLDFNKYLKAEVEYNTLYGIEVHEGRDYGDEAIMLLRDVTKIRPINVHHVTNLTIN